MGKIERGSTSSLGHVALSAVGKAFLHSHYALVIIINLDGKIVFVNKTALDLLGIKQNSIIGKNWFDSFYPVSLRKTAKALFKVSKNTSKDFIGKLTSATGSEIHVHWYISELPGSIEKQKQLLCSGVDISSSVVHEESLNEYKQQNESLLASINEAILMVDITGKVIFHNKMAGKLLGLPDNSINHFHLNQILKIYDYVSKFKINPLLLMVNKKQKSMSYSSARIIVPKGDEKPVSFHASLVKKKNNVVTGMILVLDDIEKEFIRQIEYTSLENQYLAFMNGISWAMHLYRLQKGNNLVLVEKNKIAKSIPNNKQDMILRGNVISELKKVVVTGISWRGDITVNRIGDEPLVLTIQAFRVKPMHIVVLFEDISLKIKEKSRLVDRTKLYDMITESISDGILVLQNDSIFFMNSRVKEIFGLNSSLALGKKFVWKRWLFRNDALTIAGVVSKMKDKANKRYTFFCWIKIDSDVKKFISFKLSSSNSDPYQLYIVISDMTGWVSIQNERDRFFNYSLDMLGIGGFDGALSEINPSWSRILHWDEKTLLSKPWIDFVHPDDKEYAQKNINLIISGALPNMFEVRFKTKEGDYKWLSWNSIAIFSEKLVFSIVRDVTERKTMEFNLGQAEKIESIGRLAGGVAHDFNNQLTGILGGADLIKDISRTNPNCQECEKFVDIIIRSAQKASQLTNQLLAFAKKGKFQSVQVDVHILLRDIESILQHTIDKKIECILNLDAEEHLILGDPLQLKNSFLNLIINSCDAMPDGGTLTISTKMRLKKDESSELIIIIKDTGKGIDSETMQHIFEPFFTNKYNGKASGMGLPAVYGVIQNHSGSIDVKSNPGEGTLVTLVFPIVQADELSDKSVRRVSSAGVPISHIMIVDDEEIVLSVAGKMLADLGFTVTTCLNGRQAFSLFKSNPNLYDLVILDMIMPDMNGPQTFHAIRKLKQDARIIISSGYSLNDEIDKLLKSGAIAFIQKPYLKSTLAQTLLMLSNKPN